MEIIAENQKAVDRLNKDFSEINGNLDFAKFKEFTRIHNIDFCFSHSFPLILPQEWQLEFQRLSPKLSQALNSFQHDSISVPEPLIPHIRKLQMSHPIIRVDCNLNRKMNTVEILEINCSDPSAHGFHDWTLHWINKQRADITTRPLIVDHIISNFMARHKKKFNSVARSVLLAIEKNSTVSWDFYALLKIFQERGFRCLIEEPNRIAYSNGELIARGETYDILMRDSVDEIMPKVGAPVLDLWKALVDPAKKFTLTNPLESLLGDQKSVLAFLSQDKELCILPTYVISDEVAPTNITTSRLKKEKSNWVLKPSLGYGGQGVTIGPFVNQEKWEYTLDTILKSNDVFVAQTYSEARCSISGLEDFYENMSFWIVEHQFAGSFVRISSRPVVNVHNGAMIAPVLFS